MGNSRLQAFLLMECNTQKRPRNMASSLQFCLVLSYLPFSQTLSPKAYLQDLKPLCKLVIKALGREKGSAGKQLSILGVRKIILLWFLTLSKN